MSAQRAGLTETFPAHFTHEGPGPGVHRHVSGQIVMGVKNLPEIMKRDLLLRIIITATAREESLLGSTSKII